MKQLRALDWKVLLAAIPFIAICSTALGTIPIWDARIYADCLIAAPLGHFPQSYLCAGHPTLVFAALGSLVARFTHPSFASIWIVQIAFGLLALHTFYKLAQELFSEAPLETLVLTVCLAVCPFFVVGAVDVNPDFAVTAFFLCVLRALFRERWLEAAVYGIAISFCKETGVLLLVLTVSLHALLFVVRADGDLKSRLLTLRRYLPIAAGPFLFALWTLFARRLFASNALWAGAASESLLQIFTSFSLFDQTFRAQLGAILVLQFAWVPALFASIRWLGDGLRGLFRLENNSAPKLRYLDWLFFSSLLLLTRFRLFINIRYFLPLYPMLLLCSYSALQKVPRRSRIALLTGLAIAFSISNFRTIDFASRALWGTFDFGDHPMLEMTSITNECCGSGRDQLVYNLEHLELARLENLAFAKIPSEPPPTLVGDSDANWYLVGPIDAQSHQRTLDTNAASAGWQLLIPSDVAEGKRPDKLYFLAFPNLPDASVEQSLLDRWYKPGALRTFEHRGYKLEVIELIKKQ